MTPPTHFLPTLDLVKGRGMPKHATGPTNATPLDPTGVARRGHTVRLIYKGRSGTKWVYSPKITEIAADEVEVEMLVPLAVGAAVELRQRFLDPSPPARGTPPGVRAHVTGCHCAANGLFRIRLG